MPILSALEARASRTRVATTRVVATATRAALVLAAASIVLPLPVAAQQRLTTPKQHFGHDIGADYELPNYTAFQRYWEKLAGESDRMVLDTIGRTAEGRVQLMAIITSPENHRNLDRYKAISARLARAEGLTDEQARELAREGKGIVWIDGGLHATEVLGAQQLIETVWQLVSGQDAETERFLDDLVILAVHANPDGMELVSDWYMRESTPQRRTISGVPRLYQKYVGHDNNRDFYMSTQPETENINRELFLEWYPQIMYNHHQTGPAGTVMFAPPFRDPANFNYHPLILTQLDLVGAAMHNRFITEDKGGVTMRSGANYSTWWNGGLRTTVYFHNMIGLLTETIGSPTPTTIPFLPNRQIASADLPKPVEPGPWHFRQSVDYSVTANRAVLDVASRHREQFLFNIYKMGSDAIAAGNADSWTIWPKIIAAVTDSMRAASANGDAASGAGRAAAGRADPARAMSMLRDPERRDPRAYILPADQRDFPTAVKFMQTLQKTGVDVHRATSGFAVAGKRYPAGSFVVKTAQAFRPHVLDMFEPQDHPNDFPVPGGPPKAPYDNAGWTLAYQMGVQVDRVLDGFEAPLEKLDARATMPSTTVARASGSGGYVLDAAQNDAFVVVNRLLKAGTEVHRMGTAIQAGDRRFAEGALWVPARGEAHAIVERAAREMGVRVATVNARPAGAATRLTPARIALVDRYGGSMPSGWTRWIFEQYEFPFEVIYPQQLDAGNLRGKYDAIVFVDGMIPSGSGGGGGGNSANIPAEFRGWTGNVTVDKTVPQIKRFLEDGGTVVTIGSSTALGQHLDLPLESHLMQRTPDGLRPLGRDQYYIPGSLLEVAVDSTLPVASGMGSSAIVMFDNSPVFRLAPDAAARGVRPIAWFNTDTPLRSGWAWGQGYLDGGVAAAEADVGRGKLYLFGPEVLFRAQPHGTFKLVFNGLYNAATPSGTAMN